MGADMPHIDIANGNLNGQLAAFGHGIAGVDRQVQQDLLQHDGIGQHQSRLREIIQLQGNVLTENAAQHFGHIADHFIHIQTPGLHDLAPTEGEQLPCQPRSTVGGLGNLLGRPAGDPGQRAARQQ